MSLSCGNDGYSKYPTHKIVAFVVSSVASCTKPPGTADKSSHPKIAHQMPCDLHTEHTTAFKFSDKLCPILRYKIGVDQF